MIAPSAVVAGYESIRRLLDPAEVTFPWVLIAAGLIGFAGNELVASYRIRVGRKIGSAALVADGLHARTMASPLSLSSQGPPEFCSASRSPTPSWGCLSRWQSCSSGESRGVVGFEGWRRGVKT